MQTPISGLQSRLLQICRWIFIGIVAYAPLHIFISTVIGANIGGLAVMKVLKDIIAVFGFCLIGLLSVRQKWFWQWLKQPLVIVIVLYGLHTIFLSFARPTDSDAEILGITYNLRFLVFFLYGWLLAMHLPAKPLLKSAIKTILLSAAVVVTFGLFQYWFLPNNALSHLGFTKQNGVFPAFFIDNKPNLERVMSTVRDPNSLGSYLIIIVSLLGAYLFTTKKDRRMFWAGCLLATLLCLFLTFSRSALLGCALALALLVAVLTQRRLHISRQRLWQLAALGLVGVAVIAGSLYLARNTYTVKNVIFHADQSTTLEDPNQLRVRFTRESVQAIIHKPSGAGPGTAGLASIRNNIQGTTLNENYYLQIATEVGVVGIALFLANLVLVVRQLLRSGADPLVVTALLASFAGLCLTNILVHIWSNEAVAYTWWGLAGLAVSAGWTKTAK